MIFESTDPLTGRQRFKSRMLTNLAVIAGFFVLGVGVMSAVFGFLEPGALGPMLLGDLVAVGVAWYLYTVWDKRPIRLRCPGCGKIILSNTPWVCGFCKKENRNANEYSFVGKCAFCGDEPKTYRCHHCGEFIFLTEDEDRLNYAHCLNFPTEVPPQLLRAEKVQSDREALQDEDHEIAMKERAIMKAQLDERLKIIKKRSKRPEEKPLLEAKKESVKGHVDSFMAVEEAARQQKLANAEACQGDKASLRRLNAAVEDWVGRQLAGDE